MADTMEFIYQNPFPLDHDSTEYRFIEGSEQYITVEKFRDREILVVRPEGLREIARLGMHEVNFFLRREHNESVAKILQDPLASANDREVALAMLRNAEISSQEILPVCQDTGTAIVMGKKGQQVWTDCNDAEELSAGIFATYTGEYLRYSQNAPLTMYDEVNTGTNLPAQIDIYADQGMEYRFLFVAKGGGSANKSYLYQETKALLNPDALKTYLVDKMKTLGTAACPPYHLAFVIGGTSAEATLKMVKLVSTHYYDDLPTSGNKYGRAFRDIELEQELLAASRELGIGAQFGGRYFSHDVRVVRLPRHGASCPIGMGVSCSADRNLKAKITKEGFWLEQLDHNPSRLISEECRTKTNNKAVAVDLNQPMPQILAELTQHPVATQVLLSGTIIVGRDIAHAKWKELLDAGKPLPEYLCNHPVYYAGPAKTPPGMPSGSFGPTTAGRMDPYVPLFQKLGGSMIMIAKGNRSRIVTDSCKEYGGFYLGSIGGPAALLAAENITSVECLDFAELGMEAVWKIEVKDFPAFILVDDKGNDFFKNLM